MLEIHNVMDEINTTLGNGCLLLTEAVAIRKVCVIWRYRGIGEQP